jgi:type III secretion system FlhB-like substrate exporter
MKEEKKALAIKREEDGTQSVIAFGTGKDAEAILEKAASHNIEIVQDPDEIERILSREKKDVVPERIYSLISEVVSFVTELNELWVRKSGEDKPAETGQPEK